MENRKHKRLCSAIEIMLMFIFCLPAAAIQKKSGLKRAWPFREKSYNSLFQTEDKLRGSTGARYKCKSCKATLLESKSKTMELKMSLTGCLFLRCFLFLIKFFGQCTVASQSFECSLLVFLLFKTPSAHGLYLLSHLSAACHRVCQLIKDASLQYLHF